MESGAARFPGKSRSGLVKETMRSSSPRSPPGHEIILVPSVGQSGREQLRQQCYNVRIDVFHREQGFPLDAEIDELCLILLCPRPFSSLWLVV